ncbi:MAG: DUF115 domain-containing protein [Flavobacteriia bacterium]|nr:DUF115 domain-containing protein [Flavobacteriia bacterium]
MIKKFLKTIFYKVVSPYAYFGSVPKWKQFFISLRYILASKGIILNRNVRQLKKIKNSHQGQRCFIIGNGPSLNKMDLTKLKNEITFGVNAIYLNYEKMNFHPTYYVVEDIFVAEDRADEINNYKQPKIKFFGNYLRKYIKKDEKTVFMNLIRNYSDIDNFPYFSTNCLKDLGVGGSVTYVCLELAFYMGFKEVYMIGFDHNYVIPNSVIITNERITGCDILSTEDDVNHFHKDYFGKGYRWHDPKVDRMEVGFSKANEIYSKHGKKIFNASVGGKLEVFERIDYNSIF